MNFGILTILQDPFYCTPVFGDDNQPSEYEIECGRDNFFNRQEDFADFESLWAKNITQDSEYDVFDSEGKLTQNGIVWNQTCTPETVIF